MHEVFIFELILKDNRYCSKVYIYFSKFIYKVIRVLNKGFVLLFCLLFFSNRLYAELIQWDAFAVGDELAVKDESTGLVWLDFELTAGVHYDDAAALFTGWEYASYSDVVSLLEGTFFDLNISGDLGLTNLFEQRCANTTSCYRSAVNWQELFGATEGVRDYQTHSFGLYLDELGILRMGGTYLNGTGSANRYGVDFNVNYSSGYDEKYADNQFYNYSTFLIKSDSLPKVYLQIQVSEPSNNYLFALLLCCAMWIKRRPVY